jgi:hypothetical protein
VITTENLMSCQKPEQALPSLNQYEISFLFAETPRQLNLQWLSEHPDLLNFLVASISRRPQNLVTHIQRICLCYRRNLSEHLFGAMVDFFTVLDGHAGDFCGRLLDKVLPKLNASHAFLLNQYLQEKDFETLYLVQNSFAVMGKGLQGTTQLIVKVAENAAPEEKSQDPLDLARDYIEYSQFQEAKVVLTTAILETPAHKALHLDLLELFKSLQDVKGFVAIQQQLVEQGNPYAELWNELHDYFSVRKML